MSDDTQEWALTPEAKELWDSINEYVVTCGGDPSKHVYGNTARMSAVTRVETIVRTLRSTAHSSVLPGLRSAIVIVEQVARDGGGVSQAVSTLRERKTKLEKAVSR